MGSTGVRVLVVVLALGLGVLIGRLTVKPMLAPGHQFILVGPHAKDVSGPPEPEMSRYAGHKAAWTSTNALALTIFFKKAELPTDVNGHQLQPFEDMDDRGDRFEVKMLPGNPAWRASGPINPKLGLSQDPRRGLRFKYWQVLVTSTGTETEDGKIIIRW
jgi:hypothetical protein